MARFELEFAASIRKDLIKIHKKEVTKILSEIQKLAEDPRPIASKKLINEELYRIRIGNYRVIYEIIDERLIVHVVKVGHRKDVYKN
jgi:mRNA interferase RelE/StbE